MERHVILFLFLSQVCMLLLIDSAVGLSCEPCFRKVFAGEAGEYIKVRTGNKY